MRVCGPSADDSLTGAALTSSQPATNKSMADDSRRCPMRLVGPDAIAGANRDEERGGKPPPRCVLRLIRRGRPSVADWILTRGSLPEVIAVGWAYVHGFWSAARLDPGFNCLSTAALHASLAGSPGSEPGPYGQAPVAVTAAVASTAPKLGVAATSPLQFGRTPHGSDVTKANLRQRVVAVLQGQPERLGSPPRVCWFFYPCVRRAARLDPLWARRVDSCAGIHNRRLHPGQQRATVT